MKVKMREIMEAEAVFAKIKGMAGLPARTSYRLMKQIRILGPEVEDFYKTRMELFKKYGEAGKNDKGEDTFTVPEANREVFAKELDELLAEEVEILDPIEWPADNTNLTIEEIALLEPFIKIKEYEDAIVQPIRAVRKV